VALATFCLVKITLLPFHLKEYTSASFVFFSTILSYNFIRFYNISLFETKITHWIKNHRKSLILLNILSLIGFFYFFFKLRLEAIYLLLPFFFATIFYIVPVYPKQKNLRSVATLKLFLIAFSWAGVTVLFPLIQNEIYFTGEVWVLFLQRFLIILAITIPFDLRDLNYDNIELKTLPQLIGIKKSKNIGYLATVLFFMLGFFLQKETSQIFINLIISAITVAALYYSSENQRKYYSSFWVEAIPILWLLLWLFVVL
jgi:hypothetical protein